ncbi:hypothetical protein ACFX15_002072 [Malus domestica]
MASMNSNVLAYNYAVSGAGRSELAKAKTTCMLSVESAAQTKIVAIRAQQPSTQNSQAAVGRRLRCPPWRPLLSPLFHPTPLPMPVSLMITSKKSKANKPLPLKNIPGDYGLSFVGPISDRLDYFDNQGRDEFFKSCVQK